MAWVICYIVIGVAGIGVLAVASFRVYAQVRELGREVSRARSRISAVSEGRPPLATATATHGRDRHDVAADAR
jgi:hypothetical protein